MTLNVTFENISFHQTISNNQCRIANMNYSALSLARATLHVAQPKCNKGDVPIQPRDDK